MKLAELCTVYPKLWSADPIPHPGHAIPMAVRLKLRAQRGWLQASLDTHVQRSSQRSGLGLRPYMPGDSLRALSLRHLLLQDEYMTRTDISPGRFHVSIVVHCYENMQFSSSEELPNKIQTAWATAGILENLHHQQAQKVDIIAINEHSLEKGLQKHSARLKRSHFCYVITDLLFNHASTSASSDSLAAALKRLRIPRGIVAIIRDPLESPDIEHNLQLATSPVIAFAPPDSHSSDTDESELKRQSNFTSGLQYLANIKKQLNILETELRNHNWSSLWLTPEHQIDDISRRLAARLAALKVGS